MTNKVYIITSAKFEECYIEEWVKYHLDFGFDKIIINDNNPKDYPYNIRDILKTYIDNGKVIVERYYDTHDLPNDLDVPDGDISNIYTWLYHKYENEFDWVAKLDIDEFLEIPETNNNLKEFLYQHKFDNALSIILPFKLYFIKQEYSYCYTRLKNNRDRFEYNQCNDHETWTFKSIIKKSNYVGSIGLHYAYFDISYNDDLNLILYCLPNGQPAETIELDPLYSKENNVKKYTNYINDKLYSIAYINHYFWRSREEMVNHCIKFNVDQYSNWHLYDRYKTLYNECPEFFSHPRDLYKIYFIDNND